MNDALDLAFREEIMKLLFWVYGIRLGDGKFSAIGCDEK